MARQAAEFYARGELDAAIQTLHTGLTADPNDAQLNFMLGNAWFRASDWQAAIIHYQRAESIRPNHVDTPLSLGFAHHRAGRLRPAVMAWRRAAKLSPGDSLIHACLAVGLADLELLPEARRNASVAKLDASLKARVEVDMRWADKMTNTLYSLLEPQSSETQGGEPSEKPAPSTPSASSPSTSPSTKVAQ